MSEPFIIFPPYLYLVKECATAHSFIAFKRGISKESKDNFIQINARGNLLPRAQSIT